MSEQYYLAIVQFAFIGCVIAGATLGVILILMLLSKTFREQVLEDWRK